MSFQYTVWRALTPPCKKLRFFRLLGSEMRKPAFAFHSPYVAGNTHFTQTSYFA